MKHRKYMAVCYNVHTDEIYQHYFHNDYATLKKWVHREGFEHSPTFDFIITTNPALAILEETA
jgi:hypothetical protein